MKNKIILTLIMIFAVTVVFANSIFSFYGMPVQTYGIDSYGLGMGETGFSDYFRVNSTYINPSVMVTASKITVSSSATFGFVWYEDNTASFKDDMQFFPYFNFAVPFKNHKFGFSFNSILSGDFDTQQESFVIDDSTQYKYTEIHRIDANVYKTSLLYAFKNKYLNIGVSGDIYLGHKIKYWKVDFDTDYFNDATYEHEEDLKNLGFSVGIGKKIGNFSFGGFYKSSSELYGEVINRFRFTPGADTLADKQENLFLVPKTFGAGITYKKSVYKLSLETIYEDYKADDADYENTIKYSFGFAFEPILGYGTWINNIPVRLGISYKTLPFLVNDSKVEEKKYSLGFTIPLHRGEKIDFTLSYSKRGNIDENKAQDTTLSFNIGINAFDIFSKRHRRIKPREIPEKEF